MVRDDNSFYRKNKLNKKCSVRTGEFIVRTVDSISICRILWDKVEKKTTREVASVYYSLHILSTIQPTEVMKHWGRKGMVGWGKAERFSSVVTQLQQWQH